MFLYYEDWAAPQERENSWLSYRDLITMARRKTGHKEDKGRIAIVTNYLHNKCVDSVESRKVRESRNSCSFSWQEFHLSPPARSLHEPEPLCPGGRQADHRRRVRPVRLQRLPDQPLRPQVRTFWGGVGGRPPSYLLHVRTGRRRSEGQSATRSRFLVRPCDHTSSHTETSEWIN